MRVPKASAVLGGAFALGSLGCLPSHRLVAQGDYYFEQCYGRDFEPTASERAREACWEAWLAHYTRHQPESRIDYAMRRVEDLQAGIPVPPLPGVGSPMPAQAEAIASGSSEPPADAPPAPAPLPKGCEPACAAYTERCEAQCMPDTRDCRPLCERERKRCLSGCH